MSDQDYRTERDSLGTVRVPGAALYGAQTQRAIENFPISGEVMPRAFIRALGLIKAAAARTNQALGLLPEEQADAIFQAAQEVASGSHDAHFPVDPFQTGSGTSSNMNCNEVVAALATRMLGQAVHPNDHVNMSQSSNDVIPTAIHVSNCLLATEGLLPALSHLRQLLDRRAQEFATVVVTGRTHLMDAMPVTLGQELAAWGAQLAQGAARIGDTLQRLQALPQGGTAVGSGINAHPEFAGRFVRQLSPLAGIAFQSKDNLFEGMAAQDSAVEFGAQLKVLAVSLMKIANDLRWMNSGPLAGLGEIRLPVLQPGSSIMPGKVNPVIPEAVCMVCAQVIGYDVANTVAGQSGNFQLNVMLPLLAVNLCKAQQLLTNAMRCLADRAIAGFEVVPERSAAVLARNPVLVTALNTVLGYEQGARIAKRAYAEGRPILEVAREMSELSEAELQRLLDPLTLTRGGIPE